ncbi:MAG: murein biosynthesis integral membrane protein MurJ [Actinomycetes bacterium]
MSSRVGNTSGMALGTSFSRLTGIVRDIALIAAIGTSVFSDTYSVANSIPNIIYILIAGGAINAVFIPALVRHMQDDSDGGKEFTDRLLTLIGLVLVAIVLLSLIFASQIIRIYSTSSWAAADHHVATVFALWCLPQIFFYGIYTVVTQVLNSRDVFVVPMFAPIVNNLVVIATAMAFMSATHAQPTTTSITSSQITLLGAGTTLGVVLQAAILIPTMWRSGYAFSPRFDFKNSGLGQVRNLASWTIGFVLINQISFLIISNLTTYANVVAANTGQVANGFTSYQKAQLMMMLPHSIITVSLITSLLPRLSRQSHDGDLNSFGAEMLTSVRLVIALIVPCALFLFITGPRLGVILYGHGASTQVQGQAVGLVASMFALGLPAFSIFYVLLRSYYAQENTRTPFFINFGFNLLHIGIGVTAFHFVGQDLKIAVLALAYSVAYTITACVTWLRVSARFGALSSFEVVRHLVRVFLAASLAAIVSTVAHLGFKHLLGDLSFSMTVVDVAACGVIFFACYIALASTMNVSEVAELRRFVRRA